MNIDYRTLFPDEISDEAAYHLIDFFYNLALLFEGIHLGKAMRYEKSIIKASGKPDKPWEKELPDPPF
jgi:hypothetical protein